MSPDAEWADLRRRLSLVASGATRDADPQADRHREVLEERARKLARPTARAAPNEEMTLVAFRLGGERWSVEASYVFEAFRPRQLVPLPGARAPVTGLSPWRGSVLLVLDLRLVLGVAVTPLADLAHVLVLGGKEPAFGVLVDSLGDVMRLERAALVELAEGVALHREWIRGVTPTAGFALDAERIIRTHG